MAGEGKVASLLHFLLSMAVKLIAETGSPAMFRLELTLSTPRP